MGVEREEYQTPRAVGSAVVTKVARGAAGTWSVEFELDFRIMLDDGREVLVRKAVHTVATEQRGRKPRKAA
jgi:hypothetical protein